MFPVNLDENGQLGDKYKPAIYLDTNFLRHYLNSEGAELCFDAKGGPTSPPWEDDEPQLPPTQEVMRNSIIADLVRPKAFVKDFGIIRHIAINGLSTASLILTPISLLELIKLHAEVKFKDICADVVNVKNIQRMGDKEVGKHLSHLLEQLRKDRANEAINGIVQDCLLNLSYAQAHGFHGIFYVENLKMTISDAHVGQFLSMLSFSQLEATDILHIHSAKSLGCEFFATLDQGIASNKDSIEEACGLKVLGNAQELINVLRQNIKTDA